MNIEPRNELFFFNSFGLDSLKHFIIQDDRKIIEKILIGIEQMDKTDQKITLCKIKFNLGACKELSKKKEVDSLSDTTRDFFLFHSSVWNKIKTKTLCQYLDGRRQNTRSRFKHVWNISALFL